MLLIALMDVHYKALDPLVIIQQLILRIRVWANITQHMDGNFKRYLHYHVFEVMGWQLHSNKCHWLDFFEGNQGKRHFLLSRHKLLGMWYLTKCQASTFKEMKELHLTFDRTWELSRGACPQALTVSLIEMLEFVAQPLPGDILIDILVIFL